MEGEKYNLVKAQEEAEKLKQKVESGEASNYGDAERLVEQETKLRDEKIKEMCQAMYSDIRFFNPRSWLQYKERFQQEFGITENDLEINSEYQEKAKKLFLALISSPYGDSFYKNFQESKLALNITDEIYSLPEFKEKARRALKIRDLYRPADIQSFIQWFSKFQHSTDELRADSEFQKEAERLCLAQFRERRIKEGTQFMSAFGVMEDFFVSENFKKSVGKIMVDILHTSTVNEILEAKNLFKLNDESFQNSIRLAITTRTSADGTRLDINFLEKLKRIDLPKDFFSNPEITTAVAKILAFELSEAKVEEVHKNIKEFNITSDIYGIIDDETNFEDSKNNLIKFVKYLNDEEFIQRFPKTAAKAREAILSNLNSDLDLADYFLENLDNYYKEPWAIEGLNSAISHFSVAKKLISAVEKGEMVWTKESYIAEILENAKSSIQQHQEQFGDEESYGREDEGFSESDPYENHPWLFTGQQIKISSALSELLSGKIDEARLQELGINNAEVAPLLAEVNEKINTAYQNFLEQVRSNPNIKEEDKQSLLNPESSSVRMTPLLDNVRAFVARYFVQSVEGDVTRLSEIGNLTNDLDRIIAEGFKRYIKIHEVDVPLYDKLYEEFDNLRETGRYPLEVFLGRDGIYAWIGRRAQDVARRRKMGLEGRKKLKEMGEVIEIHPQYTVYPRYFRDNLNYETKRQFLEQEGISPDADPLFYDTGYTGTIPEQIMKVMDFEDEDIEKRIRLLSAPSVHRRVKGISENARSEIIEYIEHNAKLEETAEGLIIDEKTGKIRHIARPTNPEEQFYFMMVKQAVERHYWLQEKLHHEPSGNVNLDSEHYAIRIRQDYAKLLPQEFLHDPKAFFAGYGELMKGSKGEGEYPDEEVTLFKLTDGTEIVAKRIELRKAKEARKEFAILIAAKKAGLPTAEPVGFLSGKEDADGSYLLMKKLEGHSGRKFEKELRESGKYSDEQIKDIMKQVAEKNREMAELFRTTLKIDKRWRIKDAIIEFNEETGEVESVVPIDWERAHNYNPNTPKEIDEIA